MGGALKEEPRLSLWARLWDAETQRDRRNLMRYIGTMVVWGVVFGGAAHLIGSRTVVGSAAWALVAAGAVMALLVARSYWRYLRQADELARSIQLHALALSLTAGFVAWTVFRLLAAVGITTGGWPSPTTMIVIAAYIVGTAEGLRRYR